MMQDPPRLLDDASVPTDVLQALRAAAPTAPMPEKLLARSGRRIAFMAAFPVFMASVFKTKVAIAAVLMLAASAVVVTSTVVVLEHGSSSAQRSVALGGAVAAPSAFSPPPQALPEAVFTAATEPLPAASADVKASAPQARDSREARAADAFDHERSAEDLLAEEVRLLQEAKALVKQSPSAALAKTREHAQRFPNGTLSLEREMVAVEALVAAGRMQDARSRANGLRGAVKGTIYASRLASLVGPDVP